MEDGKDEWKLEKGKLYYPDFKDEWKFSNNREVKFTYTSDNNSRVNLLKHSFISIFKETIYLLKNKIKTSHAKLTSFICQYNF